jgi:hypothetical protein
VFFLNGTVSQGKNYLVLNVRMKSKGQASVEGVICSFCFIDQANVEGVTVPTVFHQEEATGFPV